MWTDPVVEEIHQIRQKMLADVGGDIVALMAKIHAHQAASGRVIVRCVRAMALLMTRKRLRIRAIATHNLLIVKST